MTYNGKHAAQLALELDTVLPAISAKAGLAALSVDVDISGARVSRAYRGSSPPVSGDERPVFASGCLVDIFLAVICLDLHHRLGLDLDTPFDAIVPDLGPQASPAAPVTVRHLLTRTSGIQDPRTIDEMRLPIDWETLTPRVCAAARLFSPGTVFNYGGIDRSLMAQVLERFAGTTLRKLARQIIIDPSRIAIRENQWGPPDASGLRPVARFDTSTLLDVVAFLAKQGGASDNPFCEGLRNHLQVERLPLSRSLRVQPWPHAPTAFTYGLFKYSDGLIGFNGWDDNQSCAARLDPQGEVSIVVALEGPPVVRDVVVAEIAQRLGYTSVQSRAKPCTIGGLNGLAPGDILGAYDGWAEGYQAQVTLEESILSCELSYRGDPFQRVRARLEENAWLMVGSASSASGALEFFRDRRSGRVCFANGYLPYAMREASH